MDVSDSANESIDVRLFSVLSLLRYCWRSALTSGCLVAGFVAAVTLLSPRTFTATLSFAPQAAAAPGNLADLANEFGVALPVGDPSQSPAFYVDLVRSPMLLGRLVGTDRISSAAGEPLARDAADVFGVPERDTAERRVEAVQRLRDHMRASATQHTGVVAVAVTAPSALDAYALARAIMFAVDQFNLHRRQSRAHAEFAFVSGRTQAVGDQLQEAQTRLQAFLQDNRNYRGSPRLAFDEQRLQSEVDLRQDLYTTLRNSEEKARDDELRDTPVITIIESPMIPARADARGLLPLTLLGFVGGAMLPIFYVVTAAVLKAYRRWVSQQAYDAVRAPVSAYSGKDVTGTLVGSDLGDRARATLHDRTKTS